MKSKLFAQFYQKSATDNSKLIEALGDRSVMILDGRFSIDSHLSFCREECSQRRFAGFSINRGAFSSSRIVYPLERVDAFEPEKGTAWLNLEDYVGYDIFSAMVHRDGINVCLIKRESNFAS